MGIFCDRDFWTDSDRAEAAEYEYEIRFCLNPCKQKLWTTSGIQRKLAFLMEIGYPNAQNDLEMIKEGKTR